MHRKICAGNRGASLATTIMACTLVVGLAFTVASFTVSHLTLSTRLLNEKVAHNLAESAASQCLARVLTDSEFAGDTEIAFDSAPGGWGRVTFSPAQAARWGVPPSTNNLGSSAAVPSQANRLALPAASIQVVAVGRYRGVTRTVIQVIAVPPYKYALASTGNIISSGGLTVGSVDDPALLARGFDNLLEDQLKAGHLASNRAVRDSIVLNSTPLRPVLIKGSAESTGGIRVSSDARVLGGVRENGQPAPIPSVAVEDYDPADRSDVIHTSQAEQARFTVEGPTRQTGDLKVRRGLQLKGGFLYVQGNLDIYGGLTGKGAIFSTGDVKIHGVSTFGANDQQAIIAKGSVGIEGSGRDHSIFQGVIYTEGDFNAKDVTMVGALLGNKPNDGNSGGTQMQLDTCNVVYNRNVMENVWTSGFEPQFAETTTGGGGIASSMVSQVKFDGGGGQPKPYELIFRPKPKDFYDKKLDEYRAAFNGGKVPTPVVRIPLTNGGSKEFSSMDEAISVLSQENHGLNIRAKMSGLLPDMWGAIDASLSWLYKPPPTWKSSWDPAIIAQLRAENNPEDFSFKQLTEMTISLKVLQFNEYYKKTRHKWMKLGEFGFTFNPNQFIQMSDKTRRLMWSDEL